MFEAVVVRSCPFKNPVDGRHNSSPICRTRRSRWSPRRFLVAFCLGRTGPPFTRVRSPELRRDCR